MSPTSTEALRRSLVHMLLRRGAGHLGASNSVLDIMAATLIDVGIAPGRLILSKGHAAPALYVVLAATGEVDELGDFRRAGSRLEGHPKAGDDPRVPTSTGALGNGLGFATGAALAMPDKRWVCICSDGEIQEGIASEALRVAGDRALRNLTVVVDCNGWQASGPITEDEQRLLEVRVAASGCEIFHVDGHDRAAVAAMLQERRRGTGVVLAKTDRRHGLPFLATAAEVYADRLTSTQRDAMHRFIGDGV